MAPEFIPSARQFSDPVRTFAYGTDASFYRLNPKLVVKVRTRVQGVFVGRLVQETRDNSALSEALDAYVTLPPSPFFCLHRSTRRRRLSASSQLQANTACL